MSDRPYIIYGLTQSYFTRKMTAYFDYKRIPYALVRLNAIRIGECRAEGWPEGIPAIRTPDGTLMWDSTPMIHYLETVHPERGVFHPDPVQRFLGYLIEDYMDEWLGRIAVGSRWLIPENNAQNRWDIGREMSIGTPIDWEQSGTMIESVMRATCPGLGVTEATLEPWMEEVRLWMTRVNALLQERSYCFGERPALADIAIAGPCFAHFLGDQTNALLMAEVAPALRAHAERLLEPAIHDFGDWCADDDIPQALIDVLSLLQESYLPWLVQAMDTDNCTATLHIGDASTKLAATPYLRWARDVMLARYAEAKGDALDAILDRAGLLPFFSGYASTLAGPPTYTEPPREDRSSALSAPPTA